MAKKILDLREKLKEIKFDFDFLQKIDCSQEENRKYLKILKTNLSLPDGVFQLRTDTGEKLEFFYRVYESDLSEQEKYEYLQFKQLEYLKSTKSGVNFFVILTVISLIISFIAAFITFSNM